MKHEAMGEWLAKLGFGGEHIEACMKRAVLAWIAFWFGFFLLFSDAVAGFLYSIIVFVLAFGLFLYLPKMRKMQEAALIEKDMPFALLSISVELNMNVQFEKAFENASRENYSMLSRELKRVMHEVKAGGLSMQEALFNFAKRVDSLSVKRSVAQLVNAYEQGGRRKAGEPIKRLAYEQLARQRAMAKEFSGKLVVFSLMFIAVSAIVPALFQAFIIVGSMFLEVSLSAVQVVFIVAVLFPVIDIAMLAYVRSRTPVFLRG